MVSFPRKFKAIINGKNEVGVVARLSPNGFYWNENGRHAGFFSPWSSVSSFSMGNPVTDSLPTYVVAQIKYLLECYSLEEFRYFSEKPAFQYTVQDNEVVYMMYGRFQLVFDKPDIYATPGTQITLPKEAALIVVKIIDHNPVMTVFHVE